MPIRSLGWKSIAPPISSRVKLEEWGIEVHRGVGTTGVVGVLRSGNGEGTIGLRADMDALPIVEANDFAYRSRNQGKMHACGHDGHTTMLLGAARYLAETRNFNGTVNFIFQPGEEGCRRCARHVAGRSVSALPLQCGVRNAQPAGHAGGEVRHRARHSDGGRRVLRHHDHRQGRARRSAGGIDRSGAGGLPHRRRAPIDHCTQHLAAGDRGGQRHAHPTPAMLTM